MMHNIRVEYTWQFDAPLHVGSGLSRPGVADRLIQWDPHDVPTLRGMAIKGAIRMSAEEILAWLGERHAMQPGSSTPSLDIMRRLFADPLNRIRFEPAKQLPSSQPADVSRETPGARGPRVQDGRRPGNGQRNYGSIHNDGARWRHTRVLASTAIDPRTRVALDQTLRKTEVLASKQPLQFKGQIVLRLDPQWERPVLTLLLAALLATEQVGGKRSIGWGRFGVAALAIQVDGTQLPKEEISALVSPDALTCIRGWKEPPGEVGGDSLAVEARNTAQPGQQTSVTHGTPSSSGGHRWFRLLLTPTEPYSIGTLPLVSNEITTGLAIPGPALRGAFGQAWRLEEVPADRRLARVDSRSRWLPAVPVPNAETEPWCGVVPVPRSWHVQKGQDPFGGADVFDSVVTDLGAQGLQTVAPGFMALNKQGLPLRREDGRRTIQMHLARDYVTRSKLSGALFSHEVQNAGTKLVTWVYAPSDTSFPEYVAIGKRSSAGLGRMKVEASPAQDGPTWVRETLVPRPGSEVPSSSSLASNVRSVAAAPRAVFVQLLSDSVVLDGRASPLRGLSPRDWATALGIPHGQLHLETSRSVCADATLFGWMRSWGLGRAPITAIAAGSVGQLVFREPGAASDYLKKASKQPTFIGERNHEGFGLVAVAPPWLGRQTFAISEDRGNAGARLEEARPWPGLEKISTERPEALTALYRQARAAAEGLAQVNSSQLGALQQFARDAHDSADVAAFVSRLAGRDNDRGWSRIAARLDDFLRSEPEMPEVLFYLEVFAHSARAKEVR